MNSVELKKEIVKALADFANKPLADAAIDLFGTLGYRSNKRLPLKPNTPDNFLSNFAQGRNFNSDQAMVQDWQSVDFLFQLTDDEIRTAAGGNQQILFNSHGEYDGAIMESYLFFAIALKKPNYTRTELSGITRAVNRLFLMPAMLLFRHGDSLTIAIINRRLHKREESRDVLEKITLIKDINFGRPHRAHVEILHDLSFNELSKSHNFSNFVELHAAWQKTLDTSELNKRFFQEIANWYFWALDHVQFPKDAPKHDGKDHISVIRLITRLMFCWFVKEKGLIPDTLFDENKLPQILKGFDPNNAGAKDSVFYKAILQNLFFATLNTEMDKRGWTRDDQNFMAHILYRHRELFQNPDKALELFKNIPFLNGGLFECLDKDFGETARPRYLRINGFSRRPDSQPVVPDFLFFGTEREVDLSDAYGDKKYKRARVRGLIHIFNHYKFTITENTPIEEEIALDPELSGKVFENLLAAYNPETGATARKQTGSFYTPREIVNYMVDEALVAYLKTKVEQTILPSPVKQPILSAPKEVNQPILSAPKEVNQPILSATDPSMNQPILSASKEVKQTILSAPKEVMQPILSASKPVQQPDQQTELSASLESRLRHLLAYNDEPHQFSPEEVETLIEAIDNLKALDPACGSGAFPMGLLHKLVFILGKLDPHNEKWKQKQIAKANEIPDATVREKTLADIEQAFAAGELDYGRKLYLIENCIYGVDIQPIAVQIAKMRFFISLIVDQKVKSDTDIPVCASESKHPQARMPVPHWNLGIRPLPNLETKFVAANTLIGIEKPKQMFLRNPLIDAKEAELRKVRERHFTARTPATKAKCREQDAKLRAEISELLRADGFPRETTEKLANWNPYDQNASADFFDPEWMFGLREGFDIVTGNPPYGRILSAQQENLVAEAFPIFRATKDTFVAFVFTGLRLAGNGGTVSYIVPTAWLGGPSYASFRALLLTKAINQIVVLPFDMFAQAYVDTLILQVENMPPSESKVVRAFAYPKRADISHFAPGPWQFIPLHQWGSSVDKKFLLSSHMIALANKFRTNCSRSFADVVEMKRGVLFDLELLTARKHGPNSHPYFEGDVYRYELHYVANRWVEFGEGMKEYPKEFKWFEGPRILLRRLVSRKQRLMAALAEETFITNKNLYSLLPKAGAPSIKALLAIVNSALVSRLYIESVSQAVKDDFPQVTIADLLALPFPSQISLDDERRLAALVDKILAAKRANPQADTSAWEREIDERVYRLYGLTAAEIKIVEEGGSKG